MKEIEYLEILSKLKFSDEDKVKFESEFQSILSFVDEIKEVDLPEELEKDEAIALSDLREDGPKESMPREDVLKNAPKQKDGCFLTPRVVE